MNKEHKVFTVLITGSSTGFGEATARLFSERGWNVIATMRNPEAGLELAKLNNVLVTPLDVQDPESIKSAIEAGINKFGQIDAVINNAGIGVIGIFESIPPEKIQMQFDINVFGVMNVIRTILPYFRKRKDRTIINISSGVGVFGLPIGSIYTASKFALEGYSEAVSYELATVGIKVKIVEPGSAPTTSFSARSQADREQLEVSDDYQAMLSHGVEVIKKFRANVDDNAVGKVAETIYNATTDGSDQFRYIATDDIKPLIKARHETSDKEYTTLVRGLFLPEQFRPNQQ